MNNNQRDPRWAHIGLGDGSTTIGYSGCTVSAIGDVLGLTPDVVNEKLKAVGGFLGALVIWAKIEEAFPGVKINRVWSYNNDDVLTHVPNVIVEVPAAPIGGSGSHWVNYIGNHQLKDPWTGTVRPTSDFPNPTGYCVIDTSNYSAPQDKLTELQNELSQSNKDRDLNWNMGTAVLSELGVAIIEDRDEMVQQAKTAILSLKKRGDDLANENTRLKIQIAQVNKESADLLEKYREKLDQDATAIDTGLKAQSSLKDLTLDMQAICKALGLPEDSKANVIVDTILALKQPNEKAVNEYQKLFDLFFEDGLALYKRLPKTKPVFTRFISWLKGLL